VRAVRPDEIGRPEAIAIIPSQPLTDDLEDFLADLKEALDDKQLQQRSLAYILSSNSSIRYPLCEGQWLEFGVANGDSLTWAAKYRAAVCGLYSAPVHGFDTFTGLPEDWGTQFKKGHFDRKGQLPIVPDNARLWPGLFSDSLPPFLRDLDSNTPKAGERNVTYLHIDCDLYAGAKDALSILNSRIHPGAVLTFDDLLHYPDYRQHEVKALWEWLHASHRRLQVVGVYGPLPGSPHAVDLDPKSDMGYYRQSVTFVAL